jgi:hypothetical protein
MTIMGCYHDLKARVTKLELVLPAVEKSLLAEASHLRFIYSPGMYVCMYDEQHQLGPVFFLLNNIPIHGNQSR